jgi:carbon storage regulator
MLVLSRNKNQSIIIGDDVVVTVLGVRGNQVRLGIDAAPEISIHRSEIWDKIQLEGDKRSGNK